jgi:outer membrane protein assembly factor BamB
VLFLLALALLGLGEPCPAQDWPQFRGPGGRAVVDAPLPVTRFSIDEHLRWRAPLAGSGSSSPIVAGGAIFVASATESGAVRTLECFALDGARRWRRNVRDADPEPASALTGHAAATPATDGRTVVAAFGHAGLHAWSVDGTPRWSVELGPVETELGLASSPIVDRGRVFLVCDHDGDRARSRDSYVAAWDLDSGRERWRTARPGRGRSWGTPVVHRTGDGPGRLIVSGPDRVTAYDLETGVEVWSVDGLTDWTAPSPTLVERRLFVAGGPSGPLLAWDLPTEADGRPELAWKHPTGGPYVPSPVEHRGRLWVLHETGVLTIRDAATGAERHRARHPGKFYASPVATREHVLLASEDGRVLVLEAAPPFAVVAESRVPGTLLATPVVVGGRVYLRTEGELFCFGEEP